MEALEHVALEVRRKKTIYCVLPFRWKQRGRIRMWIISGRCSRRVKQHSERNIDVEFEGERASPQQGIQAIERTAF